MDAARDGIAAPGGLALLAGVVAGLGCRRRHGLPDRRWGACADLLGRVSWVEITWLWQQARRGALTRPSTAMTATSGSPISVKLVDRLEGGWAGCAS